MERTKMTLKDLAVSFHFPKFSTSRDFYKAFGCRVCMLLSYQMISVYQLYIVEDYVHQTKTEAAGTIATMSIITMVVSLTASLISGPISDKMHTHKVPVIIASLLFAIGTAMPWIMPSVTGMYCMRASPASATACTQPSTKRSTSTCCRTRKRPVRASASSTWPPRSAKQSVPPSPPWSRPDRHLHAGVRHLHRHGRVRCRVRAAYPEGEVAAASAYLRFKG